MKTQQFLDAYNDTTRNGTDSFHRCPLYPKFLYSDGVKECAEAGCYWLLDILGTELPAHFRKHPDELTMQVTVKVKDSKARITGSFHDGDPKPWRKRIDYTDMPEGEWNFFVSYDLSVFHCSLFTEY